MDSNTWFDIRLLDNGKPIKKLHSRRTGRIMRFANNNKWESADIQIRQGRAITTLTKTCHNMNDLATALQPFVGNVIDLELLFGRAA